MIDDVLLAVKVLCLLTVCLWELLQRNALCCKQDTLLCNYNIYRYSKDYTDAAWMKREKFEPPSSSSFYQAFARICRPLYIKGLWWMNMFSCIIQRDERLYVQSAEANPKFLTRITSIISERGVRIWGDWSILLSHMH